MPEFVGFEVGLFFRAEHAENAKGEGDKEANGAIGPFENPWRSLRALREK
jgi:hypothetical protein